MFGHRKKSAGEDLSLLIKCIPQNYTVHLYIPRPAVEGQVRQVFFSSRCLLPGLCCPAPDQSVARLALLTRFYEADFDTSRLLRREFIALRGASAIPLNPPFHASTNDKGSKWISAGDYCHCHQSIAFGRGLCGVARECMQRVRVCEASGAFSLPC